MQLDKYVRSFANGRLRIRHPALVGLSADEYKTIETMVLTVEGITSVQLNPSLGSALLLWDPLRLDAETLKGHLQNWLVMVDGANEVADEASDPAQKPERCSLEECANEVLAPAKKLGQTALDRAAKMLVPEVKIPSVLDAWHKIASCWDWVRLQWLRWFSTKPVTAIWAGVLPLSCCCICGNIAAFFRQQVGLCRDLGRRSLPLLPWCWGLWPSWPCR